MSQRLTESEIATIKKYGGLSNLIQRLQYLEDLATTPEQPQEVPECNRRLLYQGKLFCVQTSPVKGLQRLKEIPVLTVCRICKLERWKIPEKTHQTVASPPEIRDSRRTGFREAAMTWCPDGGIYVFPSKCESCKKPDCPNR